MRWIVLCALVACTASPAPSRPDATLDVLDAAATEDASTATHPDANEACPDGDGDGFSATPGCGMLDCNDRNGLVFPGAAEACNDIDDDCDGDKDEALGEGSCGVGACEQSAPFCVAGRPGVCTPGMPAATERCNSVDDDCDGNTDEDVVGPACGTGACARTAACVNGAISACTPGPTGAETCNRIDDDCDGTIDNGFRAQVVSGMYSVLQTHHSGCNAGTRIGPDCNAAMHRACVAATCSNGGFGPVENSGDTAIYTCVTASEERDVTYAVLATHHAGCDGARQRIGPDCNAAIHRFCVAAGHVSGFGPAELGASSMLVDCVGGGAATAVATTFTELATHHPPCDGVGQRIGPDCNAAIHRFCRSRSFSSGFGPVESSGDGATVVCVSP